MKVLPEEYPLLMKALFSQWDCFVNLIVTEQEVSLLIGKSCSAWGHDTYIKSLCWVSVLYKLWKVTHTPWKICTVIPVKGLVGGTRDSLCDCAFKS